MSDPKKRQVLMFFSGTASELRHWLNQLSTLVDDEAYEWELTASIARHPSGKRLICGECSGDPCVCGYGPRSDFSKLCPDCRGIGRHVYGCPHRPIQPEDVR